jgi:hypothetical protein
MNKCFNQAKTKRGAASFFYLAYFRFHLTSVCYSIVQLRRLEARRHKPCHPKRQRAPLWLPCLMLVASNKPPPLLFCPAPGLRGTCHKSNQPRRQRAPSWSIRLMPPASEQSPSAFYCPAPAARGSRHKPCHPKRQRAPLWMAWLMLVASNKPPPLFFSPIRFLLHTLLK